MREYYGERHDCYRYIEDDNHRAIPWKDTFSFELQNKTRYTLELEIGRKVIGRSYNYDFLTIGPTEKIQIHMESDDFGNIFVSAKEDSSLTCNFTLERGCMIKRNLVKDMKDHPVHITPIFKNGTITIVTCKDCGPNLGEKPQYKVTPLQNPAKEVKLCNYTTYDLIISTQNEVIQKIEAKEKEQRYTSKFMGIPLNGILYIDTECEEIAWKNPYRIHGDAILRVNGCCINIASTECVTITGPASSEPYIRHLYAYFDGSTIEIWCNTIDYRID